MTSRAAHRRAISRPLPRVWPAVLNTRGLIMAVLANSPATAHEIAWKTGLSADTIHRYVFRLRREGSVESAGEWRPGPSGGPSVVYRATPPSDAAAQMQPAALPSHVQPDALRQIYRERALCPICGRPDLLCPDPTGHLQQERVSWDDLKFAQALGSPEWMGAEQPALAA